jgi:hypothetical protein
MPQKSINLSTAQKATYVHMKHEYKPPIKPIVNINKNRWLAFDEEEDEDDNEEVLLYDVMYISMHIYI